MKWKDVKLDYVFQDNSRVTQKHQVHNYDCYELEYNNKKIILSKDHILKIDISNLPVEAQNEIKQMCNGKIPLKENLDIKILGNPNAEQKQKIEQYLKGEQIATNVSEHLEDHLELYQFELDENHCFEVLVKRIPIEYEDQKIDETHYWIPVEGLAYLFGKYGELDIGEELN